MRYQGKIHIFAAPRKELYPDEEIFYFKIWNTWLQVKIRLFYIYKNDEEFALDAKVDERYSPSEMVVSVMVAKEPPPEYTEQGSIGFSIEYDVKRDTDAGMTTRERILRRIIRECILLNQSEGLADLLL